MLQDTVFCHYPAGDCEAEKVCHFSPGPVDDDECLTRLIIDPIHVDDRTGDILPLAFQDACTLDLSLFREKYAFDAEIQLAIDEIRHSGKNKTPPKDQVVRTVFQASARSIRELTFDDDNSRMCFIYDTATDQKPAHASVFTPSRTRRTQSLSQTRKYQRQVRKKLFEIFNNNKVLIENYRKLDYS